MDLINRGRQHIWHPCSQMKDYESFPPLVVSKAYGPYIELKDGRRIIDAISSWWCKSLGHNHPRLKAALCAQPMRQESIAKAMRVEEPTIGVR
jgi:adenosylmethionine-8-amino-7-oxononanoate aminotransferase